MGAGNFSVHHSVQHGSRVRPAFLGVKQPGREADHKHPSNAEVKNVWSYTSTPQYVFVAWCLVKHKDYFT
jgi:hypothetical protein